MGWPHGVGVAGPDTVRALDVLQRALVELPRRLQLPASFLVDRSGALAVFTTGRLDEEQLARDLELCDAPLHARREACAASPGRWLGSAPGVDFGALESAFREAGLEHVADAYARARAAASAAPVKER
jgi:hypothetical protein